MNRDAAVVALGGGVVGDMAGFAAACYQRGIDYVQIPTTLLAQVDSSVGGKTAVNHPQREEHDRRVPSATLRDRRHEHLATLPEREYRAGIAEVVKYGLIHDAAFFDWLERNVEPLLKRDDAAVMHAVRRSCEIKAEIVRSTNASRACAPFSISGTRSGMRSRRRPATGTGCTARRSLRAW